MNWGWLDRNLDTVLEDLSEHVQIALVSLVLGCLIAFPIGLIAYRSGSLGARVFLNLEGSEITRAAALTAVVSTLPGLLLVPLCAAR